MDKKDNKRGFSGLTDLTSDTQALSQAQSRPTSAQLAAPQKTVFALIELTKWPTLPVPWSSVDSGETWVWGDFFLTFQKKPKTVLDFTIEIQGKKAEYTGMTYHYAMSVFYRINKNPHGPSHRPIMIVALEQADMGMMAKMLGSEVGELFQSGTDSQMGPLMLGLFSGDSRYNLGKYEGEVTPQAVKKRFFEIINYQLGLSDQPKMIGDLAKAHGHPETGLPAQNNNCGGIVSHVIKNWVLYGIALIILVFIITQISKNVPTHEQKRYNAEPAPIQEEYVRPVAAPNGMPWPASAGYVEGYKRLHSKGLSTVTVDNSRNDSDVFVKLVSIDSEKAYPVRHFYIPAFSSFTVNKVTAGRYDIRYRDLKDGILSRSESFTLEEIPTNNGIQFSDMTMTLYKVQNGNMQTYNLSEDEF